MKTSLTFLFILLYSLLFEGLSLARVDFPTSDDPVRFGKEIENFITESVKQGISIYGPENRKQEAAIAEDSKDWETTLAKMIGDPGKYGSGASRAAFAVATNLRDSGNRPEIIDAATELFHYEINQTMEKLKEIEGRGEKPGVMDSVSVGGLIPSMLEVGSPELLRAVLLYANSGEESKIGTLHRYTPIHIAEALRQYGNPMHFEESRKLAGKLDEIGRHALADEIRKTVESLERKFKRRTGSDNVRPTNEDSFQQSAHIKSGSSLGPVNSETEKEPDQSPATWVLLASVAFVVLGGMVVLLRHKRK